MGGKGRLLSVYDTHSGVQMRLKVREGYMLSDVEEGVEVVTSQYQTVELEKVLAIESDTEMMEQGMEL